MNIYQNILNDQMYTQRIVEAISPTIEATPYMTTGEILKYPAISAQANYFVRLTPEAIQAYNNNKVNL
jgi:hypothetical protein